MGCWAGVLGSETARCTVEGSCHQATVSIRVGDTGVNIQIFTNISGEFQPV